MRPSMALRCPANSDNSPNNTSTRSPARTTGTSSEAVEDITPSSQPGPTNSGHPSPGQAIRCQQAQPDRLPTAAPQRDQCHQPTPGCRPAHHRSTQCWSIGNCCTRVTNQDTRGSRLVAGETQQVARV